MASVPSVGISRPLTAITRALLNPTCAQGGRGELSQHHALWRRRGNPGKILINLAFREDKARITDQIRHKIAADARG